MSTRQFNPSDYFVKPSKPYDTYPLFPHANGCWAKKIPGRLHYFGNGTARGTTQGGRHLDDAGPQQVRHLSLAAVELAATVRLAPARGRGLKSRTFPRGSNLVGRRTNNLYAA